MNLKVFNGISIVLLMFGGPAEALDFITWTTPQLYLSSIMTHGCQK